jgi:hypothetical protein
MVCGLSADIGDGCSSYGPLMVVIGERYVTVAVLSFAWPDDPTQDQVRRPAGSGSVGGWPSVTAGLFAPASARGQNTAVLVTSIIADIPPEAESSGDSWVVVIGVVVVVAVLLIAFGAIRRRRSGSSSPDHDG